MFRDFGVMSRDLWSNLTAAKFHQVREFIESAQVKVGGVLCDLTVKMNAWATHFPNPRSGGPSAKSDFMMTEMRPGMSSLVGMARGTA